MSNYIAALCRMQDGALVDYDSIRMTAESEEDAKQQAQEWAASNIGSIKEPTWLRVTDLSGGHPVQAIRNDECLTGPFGKAALVGGFTR